MKQLLIAVKHFVLTVELTHLTNIRFLFMGLIAPVKKKHISPPNKFYTPASRQKGFTLIEVVVTLFIVAVALLGIMLVQKTIIDGAIDNSQRSIGVFKSSEIIDRMRTNTDGVDLYSDILNGLNPNSCLPSSQRGPACNEASPCDAAGIATRDAFDVFCGSGTKGGAVNQQFINLQSMVLDCAGDCELGKAANLTIVWNVTGANPDSDGVPQNTNVETNSISLDVVL